MKYIFLLGSNTYVVDDPIIYFNHNGEMSEVLSVGSLHAGGHKPLTLFDLVLFTNITDLDGHPVMLADDDLNHSSYKVKRIDTCIHVNDKCDDLILGVCLLNKTALTGLSSQAMNLIEQAGPSVILRVRGDFMIDEHHICIDDEKLYIDDDTHQNELHFGSNGIRLNDNNADAIAA